MYLFVGLGNPETKHLGNRHNIGFMAIDAIATAHGAPSFENKFDGQFARTEIAGRRVFLLKPQTYMNNSGTSVAKIKNFFKIELQNIFVIYDELDLALAKLKIKQGGGDGGHNGIKSLDAHIGQNYWRLRFGIDHPRSFGGNKDMVVSHVLSNFSKPEQEQIAPALQKIASEIPLLLQGQRELFLTKYSA